jgi:hypothetical protein
MEGPEGLAREDRDWARVLEIYIRAIAGTLPHPPPSPIRPYTTGPCKGQSAGPERIVAGLECKKLEGAVGTMPPLTPERVRASYGT